jgi:transposase-like protein
MRLRILTKEVLASIPALVQQGLNTEAIAARLGCTASTLKVRCSQNHISLRVPKEVKVVPMVPLVPAPNPPKPPKQKRCFAFAVPTTLQLSKVAMSRLRQRAEATGMTEAALVTNLLEVIAQDDLFDAVLDTETKKISA